MSEAERLKALEEMLKAEAHRRGWIFRSAIQTLEHLLADPTLTAPSGGWLPPDTRRRW